MHYISENDLAVFFEKNNNRYINDAGMQMGYTEKDGVWTYLVHQTYDDGPWEVCIATENDNLSSFSSGFKLKSFQDLDRLDYTNSWMRFLNGEAEIIITPMELEIPVSFKIQHHKTIIFSLEKHFYDEENRHLTLPEDFEDYFCQKEQLMDKISKINF